MHGKEPESGRWSDPSRLDPKQHLDFLGSAVRNDFYSLALRSCGKISRPTSSGASSSESGSRQWRLLKGLDIADEADALGDIVRHGGLEAAAADEGDYRMDVPGRNA